MQSKKNPLTGLLDEVGRQGMPILPLLFDLARNISNLSRIGGPKVGVVSPVDGKALQASLVEFLNFLSDFRLSTLDDRKSIRSGTRHSPKKGQRFDLDAWLRSTVILLKLSQTEVIAKRKARLGIVSRYLERPGRWHDPEGVGEEQLKAWGKKLLVRKLVFDPQFTLRVTALAVPADLDRMPVTDQIAYMRNLGARARELFEPLTDHLFPAEAFWLLFDFSLHKDAEIRDFLNALRPYCAESLQVRLEQFTKSFAPALVEIQDLFSDLAACPDTPSTAPLPAFLKAIESGAHTLLPDAQSVSLLGLILPVSGAVDEAVAETGFDTGVHDPSELASSVSWLPLHLR